MSIPDPIRDDLNVMIAMGNGDEYEMFTQLLHEMVLRLKINHVTTGHRALLSMEENNPDLLIMDIQLSDIHGWELIGKIREISNLRDLPVVVIADQILFIAPTIGPVVCLSRPISGARLRQNVIEILNGS